MDGTFQSISPLKTFFSSTANMGLAPKTDLIEYLFTEARNSIMGKIFLEGAEQLSTESLETLLRNNLNNLMGCTQARGAGWVGVQGSGTTTGPHLRVGLPRHTRRAAQCTSMTVLT